MADPFDILLGTQGGALRPDEKAVVATESGGKASVVSPKGAQGDLRR